MNILLIQDRRITFELVRINSNDNSSLLNIHSLGSRDTKTVQTNMEETMRLYLKNCNPCKGTGKGNGIPNTVCNICDGTGKVITDNLDNKYDLNLARTLYHSGKVSNLDRDFMELASLDFQIETYINIKSYNFEWGV